LLSNSDILPLKATFSREEKEVKESVQGALEGIKRCSGKPKENKM
jgi:hypothetical protein